MEYLPGCYYDYELKNYKDKSKLLKCSEQLLYSCLHGREGLFVVQDWKYQEFTKFEDIDERYMLVNRIKMQVQKRIIMYKYDRRLQRYRMDKLFMGERNNQWPQILPVQIKYSFGLHRLGSFRQLWRLAQLNLIFFSLEGQQMFELLISKTWLLSFRFNFTNFNLGLIEINFLELEPQPNQRLFVYKESSLSQVVCNFYQKNQRQKGLIGSFLLQLQLCNKLIIKQSKYSQDTELERQYSQKSKISSQEKLELGVKLFRNF